MTGRGISSHKITPWLPGSFCRGLGSGFCPSPTRSAWFGSSPVVYGVGCGATIPVSMAIIGDYFGRRGCATIHGLALFFLAPITFIGPVFAGWIFDTTGGYTVAFNTFIVVLIVDAAFMVFARKPSIPPVRGRRYVGGRTGTYRCARPWF